MDGITCCLQGSVLAGGWNREAELGLNSGPLMWGVDHHEAECLSHRETSSIRHNLQVFIPAHHLILCNWTWIEIKKRN